VCGAPGQEADLPEATITRDAVIQGRVLRDGSPVAGAYVRLLDENGEFTAEVVSSTTGVFRFFARSGYWTVRALSPRATGARQVAATLGEIATVDVELSP
jgi:uncharacterized GH25 family protein